MAHSSRVQTAQSRSWSQRVCSPEAESSGRWCSALFLLCVHPRPPAHGAVSLYPTPVRCLDYVPAAPKGILISWPCWCGFHIALGVVLP